MREIPCKTCLKFPICNNRIAIVLANRCDDLWNYLKEIAPITVIEQGTKITLYLTTDEQLNPILIRKKLDFENLGRELKYR